MTIHRLLLPILLVAPMFFFLGCGKESTEITVRELSEGEREVKVVANTAERFRMSAQTEQHSEHDGHDHSNSAAGSGGPPKLVYKTPEGWKEIPGSQMRDINLTFGKDGKGECYLTKLPGAGGGLMANVNRWRKQLGAASLSDQEISALPKKVLFGQPATLVDVSGNFGGMSGDDGKKNYRLLGLILSNDAGAVFVKMIGPKADVDANAAKLDEFVASLGISTK